MKTSFVQAMKNHLHQWFNARIPMGLSWQSEMTALFMGLLFSALYSICHFYFVYDYFYKSLYADYSKKILVDPKDPYAPIMPDFSEILEGNLLGFVIIAILMGWLVYHHYQYHFRGSKSIYLMKRLPSKNELAKRCLPIPVAGLAITLVNAAILVSIYYYVYITVTPEQFL